MTSCVRAVLGAALALTVASGAAAQEGRALLRATLLEALDRGAVPDALWGGLLLDPESQVRVLAVRVLASNPGHGTVLRLAMLAQDRDPRVREVVMLTAGRFGSPAVELAGAALHDPSPLVRRAAVWACTEIGEPCADAVLAHMAVERDSSVLEMGLANLWRLPSGRWEGTAGGFTGHRDPLLRRAAAYGLSRGRSELRLAPLRRLAADPEPVIRLTALRGLGGDPPDPSDLKRLVAALDDPDWRVRAAACLVLAATPAEVPEGADVRLSELAADARAQLAVPAARALGASPARGGGKVLTLLAREGDPWPAAEALIALARQGGEAAGAVAAEWITSPEAWRRRAAVRASVASGGVETKVVVRALEDPDPSVRLAFLDALPPGASGIDRTLADRLARDQDPAVRASLIDRLAGDGALPAERLLGLAASWHEDGAGDARAAALLAAWKDGDATVRAKVLKAALDDPDRAVSAQVVAAARAAGAAVELPPRAAPHDLSWYRGLVTWSEREHWLDLVTVRGTVRLRLESARAPLTARAIWDLAEKGFYNGLTFHRVVPNFVVQGGDPRGDGWGGPGFTLVDEPSLEPFDSWRVGVATSGPNTGGCQLFATLTPADHLTGHYTNVAEVTHGRDVLERIEVGDAIVRVETVEGAEPPPPAPTLLGALAWSDLAGIDGWETERTNYVPDPEVVDRLRTAIGRYRIVVVLGSWCEDSKREVPRLEKVVDSVGGGVFTVELEGVDRSKRVSPTNPVAGLLPGRTADRVPTLVVLDANGQELGRVVETAPEPLEHLLVELIGPAEGWR